MTRALIVENNADALQRLQAAASGAGISDIVPLAGLDGVLSELRDSAADVLIVGPSFVGDAALDLATHAQQAHGTATVLVPPAVTPALLRRAMRAGAADVVAIDETLDQLTEAVEAGVLSATRSKTAQGEDEQGTPRGKVITVFSTKGGVGKTVLATNIAASLARDKESRVALVDLDLEFGDVGIMLGLKPEHTITDVARVYDRLDAALLDGFMAHHESGVHALLAPVRPEDAETIPAARITQLLELMTELYDYVVIDTCPSFSEAVLAALDRSDEVLVVTMMDVASIKNTRISLQKLRQLGYDAHRLRIVLNRSDSKVLLEPGEVEDAIGVEIAAHVPSDRMVPRSVNKGVPIVIEAPRSAVARSMVALAQSSVRPATKEADDVA